MLSFIPVAHKLIDQDQEFPGFGNLMHNNIFEGDLLFFGIHVRIAFQNPQADLSAVGSILGEAKGLRKGNQIILFSVGKDQICSQVLDGCCHGQRIEGGSDFSAHIVENFFRLIEIIVG